MLFEKIVKISSNNVQFSRTSIRNVRLCSIQIKGEKKKLLYSNAISRALFHFASSFE